MLAVVRGKQGHNRALRMRELNAFQVRKIVSSLPVCLQSTIQHRYAVSTPACYQVFSTDPLSTHLSQSKAMQGLRILLVALVYTYGTRGAAV